MARVTTALGGGVLLGILATIATVRFWLPEYPMSGGAIERDIVGVPAMEQAVADKQRDELYANLNTVEQVLALPTAFAHAEALYVLAGRSDSAGVQKLIFDANRIADEEERVRLLEILFFRLAEIDARSALALARTSDFRPVRSLERTVWRAWARKDLDDALFAAGTQTSPADKAFAAQSLFAAYGYMGNEATARIEAELGTQPDRNVRGAYLYRLADESPADAIAFINGLGNEAQHWEYVSWLASHLAAGDNKAALRYAELFDSADDRRYYTSIVNASIARENPRVVIERMLAGGSDVRSDGGFSSAISELAGTDLDALRDYFQQARTRDQKMALGGAIARELAKKDPAEALAFARANSNGRFPLIEMSVLRQIAKDDPQLALSEALNSPSMEGEAMLISNVIDQMAQRDPVAAAAELGRIGNKRQWSLASQQLVQTWMRDDPDAAIEWVMSQDKETSAELIQDAGLQLAENNIDAAIRLLPKMDSEGHTNLRQQIAQRLATVRSPDDALAFIRQFQGQPDYAQLQASVISGVALRDPVSAKQMADQLGDESARNTAYVRIIAQRAQTDPAEAARWLNNVSDDNLRGAAAGQLATKWFASDEPSAMRWVSGLPPGSLRDDAISNLAGRWGEWTQDQEDLVASIGDRDKRAQAKVMRIYRLVRADPARARELLQDEDIPDYMRQQVETAISRSGLSY